MTNNTPTEICGKPSKILQGQTCNRPAHDDHKVHVFSKKNIQIRPR